MKYVSWMNTGYCAGCNNWSTTFSSESEEFQLLQSRPKNALASHTKHVVFDIVFDHFCAPFFMCLCTKYVSWMTISVLAAIIDPFKVLLDHFFVRIWELSTAAKKAKECFSFSALDIVFDYFCAPFFMLFFGLLSPRLSI